MVSTTIPVATDDPAAATRDAQRTWVQLSAFQRDVLATIAAFETPPKGLAILDVLNAERGGSRSHTGLYPVLNEFVDDGLVQKAARDKRTNEYSLTADGERVLRAGADRLADVTGAGE